MKNVFVTLIGALTLGAMLPAIAGPDWQLIEQARKAKAAKMQREAAQSDKAAASEAQAPLSSGASASPQRAEQSDRMDKQGMTSNAMNMQQCMSMMGMHGGDKPGMGMRDMDMQKCQDMMNSMGKQHPAKDAKAVTHQTMAIVKGVDAVRGKVTLDHEAVKSLNWPAMTMGFTVKDKTLFDKLAVGKKVQVEFQQQGSDYIVTAVQ